MAKITLPNSVVRTIVPAETKTLTELTITRMVDLPGDKIVRVFVKELHAPIVLWEGDAYDAAGQWTDSDVTARILELFAA
jgi:hypothetical protein